MLLDVPATCDEGIPAFVDALILFGNVWLTPMLHKTPQLSPTHSRAAEACKRSLNYAADATSSGPPERTV